METLKIKWSKLALRQNDEIARWYQNRMGQKAMLKFLNDIEDTARLLSCFPQMGILDERRSKARLKYYSFLFHPHYRIIYRYSKDTLFVIAIHATRMEYTKLSD